MGRGGVSFVSQGNGSVGGIVLHDGFYRGQYFKFVFPSAAPRCHDGDGFSDPTGTGGDENVAAFPNLDVLYHMIGTQTLLAPTMDYAQDCLLAGLDKTAADGVEYLLGGGLTNGNPLAHTVGAGVAKFLRVKFFAETVANAAEAAVGFRKAEAFQAAIDDYDEAAFLNLQGGDVNIETILNGGGTVTTDTGVDVADGVDVELEVRVDKDGNVTFYVNGTKYNASAAFAFDDAEVVLPFIHWLQVTGGSDFGIKEIEGGALAAVRKDPKLRSLP